MELIIANNIKSGPTLKLLKKKRRQWKRKCKHCPCIMCQLVVMLALIFAMTCVYPFGYYCCKTLFQVVGVNFG